MIKWHMLRYLIFFKQIASFNIFFSSILYVCFVHQNCRSKHSNINVYLHLMYFLQHHMLFVHISERTLSYENIYFELINVKSACSRRVDQSNRWYWVSSRDKIKLIDLTYLSIDRIHWQTYNRFITLSKFNGFML